MNLDTPLNPSQEQEARLTALLLGELSAEESAALRQRLQEDPELSRLSANLETTLGLVREAVGSADAAALADSSLKLSPARREKLVSSFKIVRAAKLARFSFVSASDLSGLAAMLLALLALAGLVAYPLLDKSAKTWADRPRAMTLPVGGGPEYVGVRLAKGLDSELRATAAAERPRGAVVIVDPATGLPLPPTPSDQPPTAQPVPTPILALGVTVPRTERMPIALEDGAGDTVAAGVQIRTAAEGDMKLGREFKKAVIELAQANEPAPAITPAPRPERPDVAAPGGVASTRFAVPPEQSPKVLLGEAFFAAGDKERLDSSRLAELEKLTKTVAQAEGIQAAAGAFQNLAYNGIASGQAQPAPQSPPTATPRYEQEQGRLLARGERGGLGLGGGGGGGGGVGGAAQPTTTPTAAVDFFDTSGQAAAQQNHFRLSSSDGLDKTAAPAREQNRPVADLVVAFTAADTKALGTQAGSKSETQLRLGEIKASTALPALQDQESLQQAETRFSDSTRLKRSAGVATVTNRSSSSWFFSKQKDERSQDAPKAKAAKTLAIALPSSRSREQAQDSEERKIEDTVSAAVTEKPIDAKPALEAREKVAQVESLLEQRLARPPAGAPEPQPEKSTSGEPFSTFSLNVSDVSFKLAAAALEKGVMPEPATVRSEEFINAFDYRDPEPTAGAPLAFAWEQARHPFAHNRDLLRFSIKTAASGRPPGRPLNIVLLLDNSGSMERADRVRIIRECLKALAGQLQPQDRVSVVAFARTPRLWVDGLPGNQAAELGPRVGGLTPEGGTNLEEALKLAYQTALRHYTAHGLNHVVLLTDGAANLGDTEPQSLQRQVEAHRRQGIALDCFGIGWEGYNDDLLEQLARHGDGRYGFVNTPAAAATEFAGQLAGALQVAASDVKVQVEFNPRRVTSYRQIGYAKHQLTKEQFRDNTVDAAEIGAAETGTALYAVAVDPQGEGPLGTVRVRYKVPGTGEYHEHAWPVPFTGAVSPLEQSSPAMRLASVAASFPEWLVSSPFADEVTADRLLGYLRGVPEVYGADPRPKRLEGMIRLANSIAGKQE